LLALVTAACGPGAGAAADDPGKLNIVTTVSPITSIVSSVVGDLAEVRGLVPEGVNSHTFEPPPSAARTLARADVVFVNGLKLEDPTRELAAGNLKAGGEVVELGDRTIRPDEYLYDFSFPREGGKPNPHLWTNPPYAKEYARVARDTLARRDPAHAGEYTANFEQFATKADELDEAMKAATATVARRELLTYHDAYAYFARHYGWKVIGAVQVSSFEEPTPREVAGLIQQVREVGVPAIFGSEVFPSKVLAQIGTEAGVRYVDTLRDDDLPGRPGDPDHSWLGLMKFNFVTMVESLGGDASALKAVEVGGGPPDRAVYPQ
jgi:ABC-type Zn uptake system ZnuABC Zn-binding protein ZnuA